jgi:hypothetical protein
MGSGAKTLPTLLRNLEGKHHAHGCRSCGQRYTDACRTTDVDGPCQDCRGGKHGRPIWDLNSDPADCCYQHSKECDIWTRGVYDLAGTRTWYRCSVCSRTHPFKPEMETVGGPNE